MRNTALLILLILTTAFQPPTDDLLRPFSRIDSTLTAGSVESWQFSAAQGEIISLVATAGSGLDPRLVVISETGAVLATNDDYDYPRTRDAAIQAMTAPYTGRYTVQVESVLNTSGNYTLTRLRGFAEQPDLDGSDTQSSWTVSQDALGLEAVPDALRLTLAGNGLEALAFREAMARLSNFYMHMTVEVENARPGWIVSVSFRQQAADTYYLFSVDDRGWWRLQRNEGGMLSTLRDWTDHPFIPANVSAFDLGVLANGDALELYYNGNPITYVVDPVLESGVIGVGVGTRPGLESEVQIRFDAIQITTPLIREDGRAAVSDQFILGDTSVIMRQLEHRREVPTGGELALNVPESSMQSADLGVARLGLGRGTAYGDFVMATEVQIQTDNPTTPAGCGIYLRAIDDPEQYVLAYLDQTGGYGLTAFDGIAFDEGIFQIDRSLVGGEHQLLVIAYQDVLRYYVDGQFVGEINAASVEGSVGNAAVNFAPNVTSCTFENTWLWQWVSD